MKEIISKEDLQKRVQFLATIINKNGFNDGKPIVFVGILNGAFMFFSDLVKNIKIPIEIDFVRIKSYEGQDRKEIQFIKDLETNIKDKHIYLVDDIIDSGYTMEFLINHFKEKGALTVNPVAVILKENLVISEALCIFKYSQDSPWFVGYGMDNEDGTCRNLKTIFEIDGK